MKLPNFVQKDRQKKIEFHWRRRRQLQFAFVDDKFFVWRRQSRRFVIDFVVFVHVVVDVGVVTVGQRGSVWKHFFADRNRMSSEQRRRRAVVVTRRRFGLHRLEPVTAARLDHAAVGRRVMKLRRRRDSTLRGDAVRRDRFVDVDDDAARRRRRLSDSAAAVVNGVGTVGGDQGLDSFVQIQDVILQQKNDPLEQVVNPNLTRWRHIHHEWEALDDSSSRDKNALSYCSVIYVKIPVQFMWHLF